MTSRPGVVLGTATGAQAAVSLVNFGLPAISPELRSELHLGLTTVGAIVTVSLLGSGVFLIPAGVWVDRYGSRRMTLLGTALAVAGLLVAAWTSSVALLAAMLFVCGVGTAIIPIAGIGALFRVFDPSRRAWALGVRQMSVPLGGTIAALILPPLAHAGGARACLILSAALIGASGVAFALLGGVDTPGEPRSRTRLRLRLLLTLPGMGRLLACTALLIVVLESVVVYAIPAARDAGLSRFWVGAVFFVIQITAGVARIVWGRIADRGGGRRRIRTLVEAGLLAALGAALFAAALHGGAWAAIPAAVVFAFGALGWNALVYVRAGELAPPELAAQSVSVAATLVFTLSAVSTPPMGALAESIGWTGFWLVCAALCGAAALIAATTDGPRRLRLV